MQISKHLLSRLVAVLFGRVLFGQALHALDHFVGLGRIRQRHNSPTVFWRLWKITAFVETGFRRFMFKPSFFILPPSGRAGERRGGAEQIGKMAGSSAGSMCRHDPTGMIQEDQAALDCWWQQDYEKALWGRS